MQFPNVSGSNLERKRLELPDDFAGQINIVLVAFQRWQQAEVDTWIPAARQYALAATSRCWVSCSI